MGTSQPRQTEVDFLLRRGRNYLALEVKSSSRFSPGLLSGLRAIGELDRLVRRILVYLGDQRMRTVEGIDAHLNVFLNAVASGKTGRESKNRFPRSLVLQQPE